MDFEKLNTSNFFESEKHRLVYFIKDEVEAKYKEFKELPKTGSVILYAGDFRPATNRNVTPMELQIMLPSEFFLPIEYSMLFKNLIRVFDLDRYDNDFETGRGRALPNGETKGLQKFQKEHPDIKLDTQYMSYELESGQGEERRIIRTRYFNPVTKEAISEVWEAVKYKSIL